MALIDKATILKGVWDVVLLSAAGAVCVFGSRLAVDHALAEASAQLAAQPSAYSVGPLGLAAGAGPIDLGEGAGDGKVKPNPNEGHGSSDTGKKKGKNDGKGILTKIATPYPLKTTVVNLAGDSNHRFAKVSITLEADSPEVIKELESVDHQIYDCLIDTLGNVRAQDIGSDVGKNMLKETLRTKMNKFLTKGEISDVYLTEFLIQ
ncbi:MAG: flagellar basal body-associated FliL family protein [Elusimicrobia bacterium]|jgi:flagellar basal body-associated protein FliL|nr:flagellar basal body-associated FliL family protein [Elusimicrobiota bacterium]